MIKKYITDIIYWIEPKTTFEWIWKVGLLIIIYKGITILRSMDKNKF